MSECGLNEGAINLPHRSIRGAFVMTGTKKNGRGGSLFQLHKKGEDCEIDSYQGFDLLRVKIMEQDSFYYYLIKINRKKQPCQ